MIDKRKKKDLGKILSRNYLVSKFALARIPAQTRKEGWAYGCAGVELADF